jgi:hypothetical protein
MGVAGLLWHNVRKLLHTVSAKVGIVV